MTVPILGGHPILYTPQQIQDKFNAYIEYCTNNSKFPNIAGYCVFAEINSRQTFYNYKERPEYMDTIARIEMILEDYTVREGFTGRNPQFAKFYAMNKFGYSDKQTVEVSNSTASELSEEELTERLKELNKRKQLDEIKQIEGE